MNDQADGAREAKEELQRTRAELRALERRFRSIIERTADGVLVVDPAGVIRFANAAAAETFGRPVSDLVGSPFGHALVVGERTEIDLLSAGEPRVAELRSTETQWDGEPATIVSLRDVTDRKRAEARSRELLREQVARAEAEDEAARFRFLSEASRRLSESLEYETTLQNVLSLAASGFADYCVLDTVVDGEARRYVAAANGERSDLLRRVQAYPFDPGADTPQARVYREREPVLVEAVDEAWMESAARDGTHLEIARELGTRSLLIVPLVTYEDCLGVFMAGRWRERPFIDRDLYLAAELGRRAALAIEHARLFEEAEAGNRAKTDFLSIMSHELRTPLSAIIGYSDLMDRGIVGPMTEDQRNFLARIRASSNHLLHIIEEILAFASAEAGSESLRIQEFTLEELVDDVVAVAEPLGEQMRLPLRVTLEDGGVRMETDAGKVRQILVNLLSNAFKFTREGEVRLEVTVEGDVAVFVVSDTGIGIPKHMQESIFERFWQVEDPRTREAGGTGLGLAVARSFAQLLGGDISLESVPGDGSAFTVRVPVRYQA